MVGQAGTGKGWSWPGEVNSAQGALLPPEHSLGSSGEVRCHLGCHLDFSSLSPVVLAAF